ncbi:MAG: hypothetical protein IGR93_17195 [Hydrococcus sp. C42_A2020_068]|nr:hypothetical protein [Hydrococcus sp. C42_A2020_068]
MVLQQFSVQNLRSSAEFFSLAIEANVKRIALCGKIAKAIEMTASYAS